MPANAAHILFLTLNSHFGCIAIMFINLCWFSVIFLFFSIFFFYCTMRRDTWQYNRILITCIEVYSLVQFKSFSKMRKNEIGKNGGCAWESQEGKKIGGGCKNSRKFSIYYSIYKLFRTDFDSILCVRVCIVTHAKISSFTRLPVKMAIGSCSFVSIILFHFSIMFCWQNEKNVLENFWWKSIASSPLSLTLSLLLISLF